VSKKAKKGVKHPPPLVTPTADMLFLDGKRNMARGATRVRATVLLAFICCCCVSVAASSQALLVLLRLGLLPSPVYAFRDEAQHFAFTWSLFREVERPKALTIEDFQAGVMKAPIPVRRLLR
jgi:hypothetical protein